MPAISISSKCPPDTVDSIYFNGEIITMNDEQQYVEAVAVSDGKIIAAGRQSEIIALADEKTIRHDLKGQTMLPGFIDAHGHFFYTAEYAYGWVDLNSAPIGNVATIEDMVTQLKRKAEETPEGEWILGWGYDDTNITDQRHPTREDLDAVSTKHPIYVQHISGWLSSANSMALEKASITKATPDPDGGKIRKDSNGELNGVIEASQPPVYSVVPKFSNDYYIQAMRTGSELYFAAGVTTAQEGWGDLKQWKVLNEALEKGMLNIRVNFWPISQGAAAEDLNKYPDIASGTPVDDNNMLVMGAHKFTADGSIQGYTGFLTSPYHVQSDDKELDYRGYPTHKYEKLESMIIDMHKKGMQIAVHGNGDGAIDHILSALEAAQAVAPMEDTRPIIIHSQMAREDQIEKMKILGAIPSFFITHTFFWGDRHYEKFMGPDRASCMSPVNSALKKGLKYTLHNDTYVTPIDPLMAVWSAVNRESSGGRDLGKEKQGVSPYEALKGVTSNAAWQNFEEDLKGTIEVGKLADFVILNENPLKIDPINIKNISVKATVVGDELVYGDWFCSNKGP